MDDLQAIHSILGGKRQKKEDQDRDDNNKGKFSKSLKQFTKRDNKFNDK